MCGVQKYTWLTFSSNINICLFNIKTSLYKLYDLLIITTIHSVEVAQLLWGFPNVRIRKYMTTDNKYTFWLSNTVPKNPMMTPAPEKTDHLLV